MNLIVWAFAVAGVWQAGKWSVDLMDVWRKRIYRFRCPTCGLTVSGRSGSAALARDGVAAVRADHEASHQKKVV